MNEVYHIIMLTLDLRVLWWLNACQSLNISISKLSSKNYKWVSYISSPMSMTTHPGGQGE